MVQNQTVQQTYLANGSQTSFAIPFEYIPNNPQHIKVATRDPMGVITQVDESLYNLLPDAENPVFVDFIDAPLNGITVMVYRQMTFEQLVDYINTGAFQAEDHERGMDYIVMLVQQLAQIISKVPSYGQFDLVVNPKITNPQPGYALIFGEDGDITSSAFPLNSVIEDVLELLVQAQQAVTDAQAAQTAAEAAETAAETAEASAAAAAAQTAQDLADVTALIGALLLQSKYNFLSNSTMALSSDLFDGSLYESCVLEVMIKRGTGIFYNMRLIAQYKNSTWILLGDSEVSNGDAPHGVELDFSQVGAIGTLNLTADVGDDGVIILKKTFFANS